MHSKIIEVFFVFILTEHVSPGLWEGEGLALFFKGLKEMRLLWVIVAALRPRSSDLCPAAASLATGSSGLACILRASLQQGSCSHSCADCVMLTGCKHCINFSESWFTCLALEYTLWDPVLELIPRTTFQLPWGNQVCPSHCSITNNVHSF